MLSYQQGSMVYWSPHLPSTSKVAGSNPGLGGPFSIFFPKNKTKGEEIDGNESLGEIEL